MASHPREYTDTDPAVMEVWLDLLRNKPLGEKLAMTLQLSGMAMEFARAGERMRRPEATEREVFLRAASRWLSRDLMIRAYGWDPQADDVAG